MENELLDFSIPETPEPKSIKTMVMIEQSELTRLQSVEKAQEWIPVIRTAIADYMYSEGCSCCRNVEAHKKHTKRIAKLLDVPKYEDGYGFDFYQFRTPTGETK